MLTQPRIIDILAGPKSGWMGRVVVGGVLYHLPVGDRQEGPSGLCDDQFWTDIDDSHGDDSDVDKYFDTTEEISKISIMSYFILPQLYCDKYSPNVINCRS